jgi:hypothetical protein
MIALRTDIKTPKESHMELQPTATRQTGMKTKQANPGSQSKNGGRVYDFSNMSNTDDVIIYEKDNSAEFQVGEEFYN